MPILEICGMVFEWHDPKYELVLSKRKITFEEVVSVFSDDFERYKGLDFSDAKPLRHNPKFKKFQDDVKAMQSQEQDIFLSQFDNDVKEAVIKHSTPNDRERLNTMIRVLFATA